MGVRRASPLSGRVLPTTNLLLGRSLLMKPATWPCWSRIDEGRLNCVVAVFHQCQAPYSCSFCTFFFDIAEQVFLLSNMQGEEGSATTAALVHFGWAPSARAAHEMYDKVVQYSEASPDVTGESARFGRVASCTLGRVDTVCRHSGSLWNLEGMGGLGDVNGFCV